MAELRKEPAIREAGGRLRGARGTIVPSMRASVVGRGAVGGERVTPPAGEWDLRVFEYDRHELSKIPHFPIREAGEIHIEATE